MSSSLFYTRSGSFFISLAWHTLSIITVSICYCIKPLLYVMIMREYKQRVQWQKLKGLVPPFYRCNYTRTRPLLFSNINVAGQFGRYLIVFPLYLSVLYEYMNNKFTDDLVSMDLKPQLQNNTEVVQVKTCASISMLTQQLCSSLCVTSMGKFGEFYNGTMYKINIIPLLIFLLATILIETSCTYLNTINNLANQALTISLSSILFYLISKHLHSYHLDYCTRYILDSKYG